MVFVFLISYNLGKTFKLIKNKKQFKSNDELITHISLNLFFYHN